MKKAHALKNFRIKSDAELLKKGAIVEAGLTGNPDFPDVGTQPAELAALNQQFNIAMVAAKSRDQVKIEQKNILRNQLIVMLERLADYVTYISNGNRAMIRGAGFDVSSDSTAATVLGEFSNFMVKLGKNSTELVFSADAVDGARFYEFYYALSPAQPDTWKSESNTKRKKTIAGLIRGEEYDVRMAAVGADGVKVFSETLTIMVV